MTWDEIKKVYPDEWVAIGNPKGNLALPYGSISGDVLVHEHSEQSFTQLLKHLQTNQTVDIRYTGDLLPDNPVRPILWQISDTNS